MSACMALEQPLRIAYLGPAGTFSHAAVAKHFGQFVMGEPCATIDEVFRAVESGQTDYAVVPVENSTEGAVGRTLDLMCQTPLQICGEVKLRVTQNLLANVGSVRRGHPGLFARAVAGAVRAVARASTCRACRASPSRATPRRRGSPPASPAPQRSPARSPPRSTASRCWRRTSRTSPTTRRASGCSAGRRSRRRARTRPRW